MTVTGGKDAGLYVTSLEAPKERRRIRPEVARFQFVATTFVKRASSAPFDSGQRTRVTLMSRTTVMPESMRSTERRGRPTRAGVAASGRAPTRLPGRQSCLAADLQQSSHASVVTWWSPIGP